MINKPKSTHKGGVLNVAEKTTFILLDRNIKQWRWWKDLKTAMVFLNLLIDANITEHGFSGQIIHRGEVVTSLPSLCNATGLTIREVRTAISHLKSTGEVTDRVYPKFRVITIVNYDKYQNPTGKSTGKKTGKRQANDRQATALKEYKEWNNGINNPRSASEVPFPCGAYEKPEWMSEEQWERDKMKTKDNIPGALWGSYETFIEYAEAEHRGEIA